MPYKCFHSFERFSSFFSDNFLLAKLNPKVMRPSVMNSSSFDSRPHSETNQERGKSGGHHVPSVNPVQVTPARREHVEVERSRSISPGCRTRPRLPEVTSVSACSTPSLKPKQNWLSSWISVSSQDEQDTPKDLASSGSLRNLVSRKSPALPVSKSQPVSPNTQSGANLMFGPLTRSQSGNSSFRQESAAPKFSVFSDRLPSLSSVASTRTSCSTFGSQQNQQDRGETSPKNLKDSMTVDKTDDSQSFDRISSSLSIPKLENPQRQRVSRSRKRSEDKSIIRHAVFSEDHFFAAGPELPEFQPDGGRAGSSGDSMIESLVLTIAYDQITSLRTEYSNLKCTSFLSRYNRMKAMIKTRMNVMK